jgi:hypothetical protein
MKNQNQKPFLWGGVLSITGALMGGIGHFVLFMQWYEVGKGAESAEPGCEILLEYIHPAMADFGLMAAVLFAVSAYGYFTRQRWAFFMSTIAIVLALLGAWFINVPYMAAGLPPVYFILFWPYLLIYFLLMRFAGEVTWSRILLGLVAGMAYIFCFMNGVASTSRIFTHGDPIFVLVERLHWVAMLGWAVVTVGLLVRPRAWQQVVGLVAAVTELVVGIPLAWVTAQQLGRFSLFALAPITCLVLLILLVWPQRWTRWTEGGEPAPRQPAVLAHAA